MKIRIILLTIFYCSVIQSSCISSELSQLFEYDKSKSLNQVITQMANQRYETKEDYLYSSLRLSRKMSDSGYKNESICLCSCQEETGCMNCGLIAYACLKPCLPLVGARIRYNYTLFAAEKYSSHQINYQHPCLDRQNSPLREPLYSKKRNVFGQFLDTESGRNYEDDQFEL